LFNGSLLLSIIGIHLMYFVYCVKTLNVLVPLAFDNRARPIRLAH